MDTGIEKIDFECKRCGATELDVPDNPSADTLIACKGCGVVVDAWGDLKRKAGKPDREKLMKITNTALTGMKNWKKL